MTNHCEHCTFWQGSQSSSRADCDHPNTFGTTAFNDTCSGFKSKLARVVKIDDNGRIIGGLAGGIRMIRLDTDNPTGAKQ